MSDLYQPKPEQYLGCVTLLFYTVPAYCQVLAWKSCRRAGSLRSRANIVHNVEVESHFSVWFTQSENSLTKGT